MIIAQYLVYDLESSTLEKVFLSAMYLVYSLLPWQLRDSTNTKYGSRETNLEHVFVFGTRAFL